MSSLRQVIGPIPCTCSYFKYTNIFIIYCYIRYSRKHINVNKKILTSLLCEMNPVFPKNIF